MSVEWKFTPLCCRCFNWLFGWNLNGEFSEIIPVGLICSGWGQLLVHFLWLWGRFDEKYSICKIFIAWAKFGEFINAVLSVLVNRVLLEPQNGTNCRKTTIRVASKYSNIIPRCLEFTKITIIRWIASRLFCWNLNQKMLRCKNNRLDWRKIPGKFFVLGAKTKNNFVWLNIFFRSASFLPDLYA